MPEQRYKTNQSNCKCELSIILHKGSNLNEQKQCQYSPAKCEFYHGNLKRYVGSVLMALIQYDVMGRRDSPSSKTNDECVWQRDDACHSVILVLGGGGARAI